MEWATKRKIIYGVSVVFLILSFVFYKTRTIIFPAPTCFDKKQNGYETGTDCGGTCSLRCFSDVSIVEAEWSRAIRTSPNTYDLVGMLANKNINSAPLFVSYIFTVFNKNGKILDIEEGSTTVLLAGEFPVIKQNIFISEAPAKVLLKLNQEPYYAVNENPQVPSVRITSFTYQSGDISRIYVNIINTTRNVYLKLPIRMVAYDEYDNAIAVGESIIPSLGKEEQKQITFVWHSPLPTAPTRVRAYPIISPFSVVR